MLVDKNFSVPTKFPVMGYGPIRVAPYAWPGSRNNGAIKGSVEAPPLPADLRPTLLLQAMSSRPDAEGRATKCCLGRTAPPSPCVPIVTGQATTSANQTVPPPGNTQATK